MGHISYQKTSDSKHLQIQDSEQGHSELSGRITVIVFNVPFPYTSAASTLTHHVSSGQSYITDNLSFFYLYHISSGQSYIQLEFPFLSCFKWSTLHNGQLEFLSLSYFKWSVLHNGQLEFTFLSCFKWSVLRNRQFEFTFLSCFKW